MRRKYALEFFSIGGGLGIVYQPALASGPELVEIRRGQKHFDAGNLRRAAAAAAAAARLENPDRAGPLHLRQRRHSGHARRICETHRQENFVIVDAAMNDLIRPAFYDAYHEIVPLIRKTGARFQSDVVGGICESGDYFCKDRPLPKAGRRRLPGAVERGRLRLCHGVQLQHPSARRRSPGERHEKPPLVRERQPIAEIWAGEKIAPWLKH